MSEQQESSVAEMVVAETTTETPETASAEATPPVAPDAAAAETEQAAKPEDVRASRLAALARREKQAREAETKARAASEATERQIAAFKAEQQRIEAAAAQARAMEERIANARRNPMEALKALGLDYRTLTEAVLQDGKPTPEMLAADMDARLAAALEAKTKPLLERLEAFEKEREAAEAARVEAQYAEARNILDRNVRAFLASPEAAEKYEGISAFGAEGEVSKLIDLTFQQTGRFLTYEQAAKRINDYIESNYGVADERRKAYYAKRLAPPPAETPAPAAKPVPPQGAGGRFVSTKTLTNAGASAAAPATGASLSREEALERAKLRIQQSRSGGSAKA